MSKNIFSVFKMMIIMFSVLTMNTFIVIGMPRDTEYIAPSVIPKEALEYIKIDDMFYKEEISDELFKYIYGKSFKENCTTPRDSLTYVRLLYYGFDKETHVGELIVNKYIADDIIEIFKDLYLAKYPIQEIVLVDHYEADDELSMKYNNTSSFNFRHISGSKTLSKHSLGLAIDINPLYNPYVTNKGKSVEPANAKAYVDRSKDFPYKIDHNDLVYKLFTKHGFTWGGDWKGVKDYQHFEKDIVSAQKSNNAGKK